jgi:tetratricopeptide (TPR) repeat protein
MDNKLAQTAITEALAGNWKEAVTTNKLILKKDPKDTDALVRLARAYAETGELNKAKRYAKKALKLDPFNNIAKKSLEKWKELKDGETITTGTSKAQVFLEEPGKTKLISLIHTGDAKLLSSLDAGDEVSLKTHSHKVCVVTSNGKYIGKLPDDLSARLKKLIKYGNEYQAFIKSIEKKEVKVFIREIKRVDKLSDIPSFSTEKIDYISFTPPELVHKKEDIIKISDEEE